MANWPSADRPATSCTDRDVDGYVTPAFIATVGLTLLLLVAAANLLAVHYARGVMQAAVEEGARQGAATGAAAACAVRVEAVLDGLGALGDGIGAVECAVAPAATTAALTGVFEPWVPLVPTQSVEVDARVAQPAASS
ncbi:hypothetical protein [Euzebya sp.]|uniref:hypothetical protein n=1 Tax=Euzebya sp. TaxID=1971409 RepID=UPI003515B6E0